jgi:hypothetical protein
VLQPACNVFAGGYPGECSSLIAPAAVNLTDL